MQNDSGTHATGCGPGCAAQPGKPDSAPTPAPESNADTLGDPVSTSAQQHDRSHITIHNAWGMCCSRSVQLSLQDGKRRVIIASSNLSLSHLRRCQNAISKSCMRVALTRPPEHDVAPHDHSSQRACLPDCQAMHPNSKPAYASLADALVPTWVQCAPPWPWRSAQSPRRPPSAQPADRWPSAGGWPRHQSPTGK